MVVYETGAHKREESEVGGNQETPWRYGLAWAPGRLAGESQT